MGLAKLRQDVKSSARTSPESRTARTSPEPPKASPGRQNHSQNRQNVARSAESLTGPPKSQPGQPERRQVVRKPHRIPKSTARSPNPQPEPQEPAKKLTNTAARSPKASPGRRKPRRIPKSIARPPKASSGSPKAIRTAVPPSQYCCCPTIALLLPIRTAPLPRRYCRLVPLRRSYIDSGQPITAQRVTSQPSRPIAAQHGRNAALPVRRSKLGHRDLSDVTCVRLTCAERSR
ncbi:hypothetical protein ElyMa_002446400 [Elysia marginata]|uniref:Uncharacterized protein n=1 Tax=Elysia marginata TaxID=1093978 RepID=A0AAV4GKQ8_9GAST|nr:hypothetical protein ElyMa_002446400 [Elysia marginata]